MSDEPDIKDLKRRMEGAISALKTEFQSLRTGRASATMLDSIMVDAYGTKMPIVQCGTVNVPEPRLITLNVWDKSMVSLVDKAIRASGLGINPVVDGTIIRLPIPELNEERRKELTKVAGKYAENARISVRNVRRDGMDIVKKSKTLSEDDQKIYTDEIQELTNDFIAQIDTSLANKEKEIMQV
jgi:ribosome recycling factor